MENWLIAGGEVLREGRLARGELALAEGRIAEAPGARVFDASGLRVLPGLVDIHGDAFERLIQPRPGVPLPLPFALREAGRALLGCGITTAFLAVTLSWEPGLRSIEAWRALRAALPEARAGAGAELLVHLRFEVDNLDGVADALSGIADGSVRLLAFNDHTPSIARKLDRPAEVAKYTSRVGLDPVEFRALTLAAMERRDEVPAVRERLAAAAREAGIAMLSHDDSSIAERDAFRALGARISEFPTSREVAEAARRAGDHVVMGAPNVVRGGSHIGWASAGPLAEEGLVTILASDYVWPAMLEAALALEARGRLSPAETWALVSANPAEAAGLPDRGRLALGLRGDVVLLDAAARRVVAAFAEGRLAFLAPGAAARLG